MNPLKDLVCRTHACLYIKIENKTNQEDNYAVNMFSFLIWFNSVIY